jgi:alpha-beta hydrolase superfamily lysophospholipase
MPEFQLAEIVTKDKLVHQGIFFNPSKVGKKAILWVHGITGRFYGSVALMDEFARVCESKGFGFASFNTRGHDLIASVQRMDKRKKSGYAHVIVGAGYENFTDSAYDLDAAITFLVSRGFSEVIILGHSTGANKACYYAAVKKDARVKGIVLAGPMSDRSEYTKKQKMYARIKKEMEQKLKAGKGNELLTGKDFFPLTPRRWMSLYSPGSAEDVFNYMDTKNVLVKFSRIRKPLLVVLSERDEYADRPIEKIRQVFDTHAKSPSYKSIVIPDTNHKYLGKEKEFVYVVVSWVASL